MRGSFFHTAKPRQFSFKPRYYDERKEELENIRKKYEAGGVAESRNMLKMRLDRQWRKSNDHSLRRRSSGISLLIFVIISAFLLYFLFR